jgi:hypothetical protein
VCVIIYILYSLEPFDNPDTDYSLAFYTCFYGTNNNAGFKIPDLPSDKYDCYYISNNKELLDKLNGTKWIGIFHDKPITEDQNKSAMYSKEAKTVPENFKELGKYDYTCYFDSKLSKISEKFVESRINECFVSKNYALVIREHEFLKGSVWNEFDESLKQTRYFNEKDRYREYINKQISKGLKDNTDYHCQTGFIIRNMNHPKIKELDQVWFSHVNECGIQCQISFYFVKQLFEDSIYTFKESPFIE